MILFARVLRALMNKVFMRGRCNKGSQRYNWWGPQALPLQRLEQNNGLQRCAVGLQFQSYNSLCASMQVILSSLAKGVQHNNPRTRWGAQYNNPQTRWNTLFSSLMAPKRLGEGANQDNVNNRARSDSSMMEQGCHLLADGTWSEGSGVKTLSGRNCVGRL